MSDDALLALERYAEVLAYWRAYPPTEHAAILGKLAVPEEAFVRAHDLWPRKMASTLQSGDATLHLAFARAYNEIETCLRLVRPKLDEIRPRVGLETVKQRAAVRPKGLRPLPAKPTAEPDLAPAVATAVPTYLQPHRREDAGAHPVEGYVPPAGSAPAVRVEDIDVDETGAIDPRKLSAAILPFLQGLVADLPPMPSAGPPPPRSSPHPDATEELGPEVLARVVTPLFVAAPPPRGPLPSPDDSRPDDPRPGDPRPKEDAQLLLSSKEASPPVDTSNQPMTLERYAAVSAELASGEQAEVLARLGITRPTWLAAMGDMATRFKAEPDLEAKYRPLMRGLLGIPRPR